MSISGYLPLPRNERLAEFVVGREPLDRDFRANIAMPKAEDTDIADAVLVALHCMAQDEPVFLIAGLLAFAGMALLVFYRICFFLGSAI